MIEYFTTNLIRYWDKFLSRVVVVIRSGSDNLHRSSFVVSWGRRLTGDLISLDRSDLLFAELVWVVNFLPNYLFVYEGEAVPVPVVAIYSAKYGNRY